MVNRQSWANEIGLTELPEACRDIAEIIGVKSYLALVKTYAGESVYLPKPESLFKAVRDKRIRSEFDGGNYRELAQKYNLTVAWVRRIVNGNGRG